MPCLILLSQNSQSLLETHLEQVIMQCGGKAYDPRLIVAWLTAQIAVMGGAQAAKVLLQIEKASLKSKGEEITLKKKANAKHHYRQI